MPVQQIAPKHPRCQSFPKLHKRKMTLAEHMEYQSKDLTASRRLHPPVKRLMNSFLVFVTLLRQPCVRHPPRSTCVRRPPRSTYVRHPPRSALYSSPSSINLVFVTLLDQLVFVTLHDQPSSETIRNGKTRFPAVFLGRQVRISLAPLLLFLLRKRLKSHGRRDRTIAPPFSHCNEAVGSRINTEHTPRLCSLCTF